MDQSINQQLGEIGSLVSAIRDALGGEIGPIWATFVA
jgi:hypothetical protein